MILFWTIRYLDSRDKKIKYHDLWLDTSQLKSDTRAAVELCHKLRNTDRARAILRFRHLFQTREVFEETTKETLAMADSFGCIPLLDYLEDDQGNEISYNQLAVLATGDARAITIHPGAKQHDVDFMLAEKRSIDLDAISLTPDDLNKLATFTKDLRELLSSSFSKEGPGTLESSSTGALTLATAATEEEITSYVTIFRRLYMRKEPAGFLEAVSIFSRSVKDHADGMFVEGIGKEYKERLESKPYGVPFIGLGSVPFTVKRLIDVFLYTQYAHQPDAKRSRQFRQCLAAVRNSKPLLAFMFLYELWACSLHMRNAGPIIAEFVDAYCNHRKICPDVIASISGGNPGIGTLEKKKDFHARVFTEAVQSLAEKLWEDAGRPDGGPAQLEEESRNRLENKLE